MNYRKRIIISTIIMKYAKFVICSRNSGPMSWGALLNKESAIRGQGRISEENEFNDREQDPNLLYLSMDEQRNVNGGYPAERSMRTYRNTAKRYFVAKRSPKAMPAKKEITDPKVINRFLEINYFLTYNKNKFIFQGCSRLRSIIWRPICE